MRIVKEKVTSKKPIVKRRKGTSVSKRKMLLCVLIAIVAAIALFGYTSTNSNRIRGETLWTKAEGGAEGRSVTYAGSGTESDPYLIDSIEKLQNMKNYIEDTFFRITQDLDATGYNNFTPIGTANFPFRGILDGANHKIKNLSIESAEEHVGIFGYIDGGEITNLVIENIKVKGIISENARVGGLAGYAKNALIENIIVTGNNAIETTENFKDTWIWVGGLIGDSYTGTTVTNARVEGMKITVKQTSSSGYIGGLIGQSYSSTTRQCYSKVNIENNCMGYSFVGGLIGFACNYSGSECFVEQCYSVGDIGLNIESGTSLYVCIGGLVGCVRGDNTITVKDTYSTVNIRGKIENDDPNIGGLIGGLWENTTLNNSYSVGEINVQTKNENNIGGIVGNIHDSSDIIRKSYWAPETSQVSKSAGGESRTIKQMIYKTNYDKWDFDTVWEIKPNGQSLPYLKCLGQHDEILEKNIDYMKGSGTQDDPYLIDNVNKLQNIRDYPGENYFKIIEDIDASEKTNFIPIGTPDEPFRGHLDGNNHKVTNLKVDSEEEYTGLFGYIDGGTVKDLELGNINVKGNKYIGGLAGYTNNATITNVRIKENSIIENKENSEGTWIGGLIGWANNSTTVTNSDVEKSKVITKATSSPERMGGLIGHSTNSSITRSYTDVEMDLKGTTTMNSIGGLIGQTEDGNVQECYSVGNITLNMPNTTPSLGGLIGDVNGSTGSKIKDVYSKVNLKGQVSGNYKGIGGLIGNITSGTLTNGYAIGERDLQIINYNQLYKEYVGGLVGHNEGSITDSYWSSERVESGNTLGEARIDQEMMRQENYNNWNFVSIWGIKEDETDFPYLINVRRALELTVNISNINEETSQPIANTKYDVKIEYNNGATREFLDIVTDSNGNIRIENIPVQSNGKNIKRILLKQKEIREEYSIAEKEKYVGIKINSAGSGVELTGAKSEDIFVKLEDETVYITQMNYAKSYNNKIRINAVDNIDNDITVEGVNFQLIHPDGRISRIRTDENGIAELDNVEAPGVGTYLYQIEQINKANGYKERTDTINVSITFDEDGLITGAQVESGNANAHIITEQGEIQQNIIANINMGQERTEGLFGDYKIKVIETDKDTTEAVAGVTYKIRQRGENSGLTTIVTANKKTNSNGQVLLQALAGNKLTVTIKRTKVPDGYKLKGEEIQIKLVRNAAGEYVLESPIEGVTVDTANKLIIVDRSTYKRDSQYNDARTRANNTIFITKVDEELRPLQGVIMELREMGSGKTWELKTDDNGLAKINSQTLIQQLGCEFPQYLQEQKGHLTFWITEKSVPFGYESLDEDIGFETNYEYKPDGTLEMTYMNILDGLSYYHIVNQEYDQYEAEEFMQVDIRLKVINRYSKEVKNLNTIRIEKVDFDNEKIKLKKATFQVTLKFPVSGKLRATDATGTKGILDIPRLYFPEGTTEVEIIEKVAPEGYILDRTPKIIKVTNTAGKITVEGKDVVIDEAGRIKIKIKNTREDNPYNVVVQKRDAETGEVVYSTTNFGINIIGEDGETIEYVKTTRSGSAQVSKLNGTGNIKIEVREENAPIGYILNEEVTTAYITKENVRSDIQLDRSKTQPNVYVLGNTVYIYMYNLKDIQPILQLRKVDNGNKYLGLQGAQFTITMPDERNTVRKVTTLASGYANVLLSNGISGRYIIEETVPPAGYYKTKKIALDVVFDENKRITSCEIVKDLGEEFSNSVISKKVIGGRIELEIGDTRQSKSTYTIKIDKVSSWNDNIKLDNAQFDINIQQENGLNYALTRSSTYHSGAIVSGLTGTGEIKVVLQEIKAPSGYIRDATIKELKFIRNPETKRLELDTNSLSNIDQNDIIVNNVNHTVTIRVRNTPINVDSQRQSTYITIENEDINNHSVKIEGTRFEVHRLSPTMTLARTNEYGLTGVSIGVRPVNTTETYLIRNDDMWATSYIRNADVVLQITYNASGAIDSAKFISESGQTLSVDERGRAIDSAGRIVAEIDESIDYVGRNHLKIKIRCLRVNYTSATGGGGGSWTWGGSSGGGPGGTGGGTWGSGGWADWRFWRFWRLWWL